MYHQLILDNKRAFRDCVNILAESSHVKNYSEPGIKVCKTSPRNLDWILGPHPRVFTNKRQPADTQARLWLGSWPDFWEQIDDIFLWQTDHQRLHQRMLPFPIWNRHREDFSISMEFCLKEIGVTQDSTNYPRFAVKFCSGLCNKPDKDWLSYVLPLCVPEYFQNILGHIKVFSHCLLLGSDSLLAWVDKVKVQSKDYC